MGGLEDAIARNSRTRADEGMELKWRHTYPDGMRATNLEQINPDLLAFFKAYGENSGAWARFQRRDPRA